jgi:hypothetical protein
MDVNCQYILDTTMAPHVICVEQAFFLLLLEGHCLNDLGSDRCDMISSFKG